MILNYEEGDVFGPGEVESTGPLMWEPDHVAAGKPAPGPRKPVKKPSKKPRQPVTGTGQQLRDAKFQVPFFGSTTAEEYQFEVEGGQPEVRLNVKPSTSMDFHTPLVGITTETPKAKLKPVKVIKREGESPEQFLKRADAFDKAQQFQKKRERSERAAVSRKVIPNRGAEKYLYAGAQGVENVLGPIIRTLGPMVSPGDPEEMWQQPMPRLNEREAGEYGVKVVEGLGSTIPYGITAALTGTAGTALLGASSNGASTYEEAIARGVGHKEALAAAIPGALIGSLEGLMGLGTGQFLGQMGKGTLKGIAKGIGEEEFQELTTQALNNVNAKIISGYDPQRAMTEGLWETFTTTLGTAGLMHGATAIGSPQQRATQAIETLPVAEQLEVGNALADTSPRSFASLPPRVREAAMLNWHMEADPRLKKEDGSPIELFHGTQSPKVIEEIDMSKADPNGLYGPGFYMTQSSEIAAGEGGYALTKFNKIDPSSVPLEAAQKHPEWEEYRRIEGSDEAALKSIIEDMPYAFEEFGQHTPHAYKLFANIRKPFDIDSNLSPETQKEIFGVPLSRNSMSGEEIYSYIVNQQGSKEKANSFLKEAGFDGITHIGGSFRPIGQEGVYFSRADAEKAAKERGAEIHQTQFPIPYQQDGGKWTLGLPNGSSVLDSKGAPITFESEAAADAYRDQFSEAYVIKGHRVWIALDKANVKSAWSQEFDSQNPRIQASFKPNELQAMEQRATKAGKPLALTPETRDAYTTRNQEIRAQLLVVDPTSPEFARLSDEYTGLARAIEDSPTAIPQSTEELRQHLIQMNMGHEGAAGEMLDILRPPAGRDSNETDRAKSSIKGARFYPLRDDATRGGTVYLTPETFEQSGLIDKGQRSQVGGLNITLETARDAILVLADTDPTAVAVLQAAYQEAVAKGLPNISILSYVKNQGLTETRKLVRHESFHTGQAAAANEAGVLAIDLHPDKISYHPELLGAAQTKTGQWVLNFYEGDERYLAFELAAYSAAGQNDLFGMTNDQAASYLTDYLTGIADLHGVEALSALAGTARLSPKVQSTVKEIQGNVKQSTQRTRSVTDWAAQLRSSASSVPEGPKGSSDSRAGLDAAGSIQISDQDETGGLAGGPVEGEGIGAPPPDGGNGGVVDKENPLFTTVLTSDVVKEYAKKSGEALRKLGLLDENSLLPPHEQILKVLKERPDLAEPAALGAALREQGVTGEETLKQIDEAAANAGRTLQAIQAADAEWTQLIKQHPEVAAELAKAGVGPKPEQIIKQGLKEVQASILGRSLWRRSGDLFRKMLLTRFSTAANNAVSTVPRIPLDLIDGAMTGTAMGMLQPEKWAGKSDATVAEGAKAGALAGMQASTRVAMAFPDIARRILKRAAPAHEFNEMVIAQMEQLHPDLHSKLEGRSTGLDEFKESSVKLDTIRDLLPYLNDGAKFKEYSAKLDLYQKRYDFNHKLAGKLFDKTNWAYDQFLKPGNVQEFFFRRPYFVGALAKRAAAAGFDLSELATNAGTLKNFAADPKGKDAQAIMQLRTLAGLPPEVWEAAADDALTFTYAYNPHRDRGGVEKFASHYIEFMDSLGPVGAVVDAFPKAVYNGLKFAYEYGPVGMIKPVANITDNVYQGGGRNGIEYNDVSRISKALLGTAMYATAIGIRKELGGEEWWQIKTGKKNKKGEPEYLNVKKWMPFAGFLYVADLILRMKEGRMIDKKPGDDMAELYLGARRADSGGTVFSESIKEVADYWASGDPLDDTLLDKAGKPLGNILGAPLTPFINLRDLIAQFDEDEAARRDTKESPFLGPAIDKIPWLRSSEKYGLPLYQPPTELVPRPTSAQPALTELGIATDPGSNFATREFSRLGLSPVRWLRPDPDPLINRAQYAAYARKLGAIAPKIEASDRYQAMSDAQKAAFWEAKLAGPDGIAAEAKELGEQANPQEINRREILESQAPLQRKATGLDKKVKEMKNGAVEKPAAVPRP